MQIFNPSIAPAALLAAILIAGSPVHAARMAPIEGWAEPTQEVVPTQIRAGGYRGGRVVAGGHRGGAAVVHGRRGSAAIVGGRHYHGGRYYGGGAVVRHGYGGAWVRPYRWGPGGAIAAGAAIGFVTAATAAAWASAPPQPGLCWYYTDPSQRAGFWDTCPR
jgi:hypothetical protein